MKLGSINLSKMYVGVSEVIKAYIGSTQTYSNDPYYVGNFLSPELTFDFGNEYYRTDGTDTTFPSAITHSRASNATMVDNDGLLKWAPHNLLKYSDQFDNASWVKSPGVTVTANTDVAPDGTTSADTVTSGGNQITQGVSCVQNTVYTDSLFFKKTTEAAYTPALYLIFTGGTLTIYAAVINTNTGVHTVVTASGFTAPSAVSVSDAGAYWRLSVSGNSGNNTTVDLRMYPNLNPLNATVGPGSQVIWGAHLYRSDLGGMVNNPDRGDSYVPTTSASRYLPRRGHHVFNGVEWVNEGLLVESEARTNLTEDSNEFDTANWSLSDAGDTLTSSATVSPDGETNAWLFAPDSTSGFHSLRKPHFFTAGIKYTISVFLKSSGRRYSHVTFGGSTLNLPSYDYRRGIFDLESGSVYSAPTDGAALIEPFGNGWYRCSVTITPAFTTSANLDVYHAEAADPTLTTISDGNGTDGIYIYGAQLEQGFTPSSYIPTSGSTVTRAADTITVPSANLPYDATNMSIQMQGRMTYADEGLSFNNTFWRWYINSGYKIEAYLSTLSADTGNVIWDQRDPVSGADLISSGATTYSPGINVPFNIASRHGSTFINGAVDGTALMANLTPTALPDLSSTDLEIAYDYMGTISLFRIWDADLGDSGIEEVSS